MDPVPAMDLDDAGLVTIGVGVYAGATECLGSASGESLHMLGVEAVAERMADHVVGHHPTMPGARKTEHAVHSTRRLEDRLHPCIMTIVLHLCKTSKTESLFELNPVKLGVPPKTLVKADIPCQHFLTSYLFLLSQLTGGVVLPLDPKCVP